MSPSYINDFLADSPDFADTPLIKISLEFLNGHKVTEPISIRSEIFWIKWYKLWCSAPSLVAKRKCCWRGIFSQQYYHHCCYDYSFSSLTSCPHSETILVAWPYSLFLFAACVCRSWRTIFRFCAFFQVLSRRLRCIRLTKCCGLLCWINSFSWIYHGCLRTSHVRSLCIITNTVRT